MSGQITRTLWGAWESMFHLFARVHPLQPGERHLLLLAKRRYLGRPFVVDGVPVRRFDKVIELHFDNEMILRVLREENRSLVGSTVKLLREAKRAMPLLAQRVAGAEFADAAVLYGVTFIHRGVEQFGFGVVPLHRRLVERVSAWYLRNIFRMVNPNAGRLLQTHHDAFIPRLVAVSKAHLMELYGVPADSLQGSVGPETPTHLPG